MEFGPIEKRLINYALEQKYCTQFACVNPFPQVAFYCKQCSMFICYSCKDCHTGHELEGPSMDQTISCQCQKSTCIAKKTIPIPENFPVISGAYSLRKCTKTICGLLPTSQRRFNCLSCKTIICYSCALTCHSDHNCVPLPNGFFSCGCSSGQESKEIEGTIPKEVQPAIESQINKTHQETEFKDYLLSSLGEMTNTEFPRFGICLEQNCCTLAATGEAFFRQSYYHCKTCGFIPTNHTGACAVCLEFCHRQLGHDIDLHPVSGDFYCDCGSTLTHCRCSPWVRPILNDTNEKISQSNTQCVRAVIGYTPYHGSFFKCSRCSVTVCANCNSACHSGHQATPIQRIGVCECGSKPRTNLYQTCRTIWARQ